MEFVTALPSKSAFTNCMLVIWSPPARLGLAMSIKAVGPNMILGMLRGIAVVGRRAMGFYGIRLKRNHRKANDSAEYNNN